MDYNKLTPIVEKAQSGDKAAMNELLEAVYKDLYFHAKKAVRDEHLAEDITQETSIEIFTKLKTLKVPKLFPVWAKRILHNKCASHFRGEVDILLDADEENETLLDRLPDTDDTHIPEKVLEDKELGDALMSIVDSLPAEQRMATILYFYEQMTSREIATIQGTNEETVKSRLRYSRKALKTKIEEYEQKHGTKLHGVAILPLLMRYLFKQDFASTVTPNIAEAVSAVTIGSTAAAATGATVASATTTAAATGAGIGMGIGAKIVAGILAAGVIIGGAVGTASLIRNRDDKDDESSDATKVTSAFDEPYTVHNDTTQIVGTWRYLEDQWISSDIEADFDETKTFDFSFNLDGSVTTQGKTYPCVGEPSYQGTDQYGTGFCYRSETHASSESIDICGLKVDDIFFVVGDDGKYIAELRVMITETLAANVIYYRVSDYNDDGSIKTTDENGEHLHTFGGACKYNERIHWYECACGTRSFESTHNGEGGRMEYDICTICGYKDEEKLAESYASLTPSEGLEISVGESSCKVMGFGSCTDRVIVIPETYEGKPVTAIASGAFARYNRASDSPYSEFDEIHLPPTLTSIGDRAFWGADSLKRIYVYSGNRINVSEYAFWECKSLESIDASVFTLNGKYLFSDCTSFYEFEIPEGVETVGKGFLNEATSLYELYIPSTMKEIPVSMCYSCINLTDIYFGGTIEQWGEIIQNSGDAYGSIEKSYLWWEESGEFTVHCIDGNLSKQDAVVSGFGFTLSEWKSFE